jgi:TetR/AcrR family transcriptional repressor of nem operon
MPIAKQSSGAQRAQAKKKAGRGSSPVANRTPDHVLDVAEHLVQTRGFNGMSYADVAVVLHITKASLHYHFRTKAELGARLIARYEGAFLRALAAIDAGHADPRTKLREYARIYEDVLRKSRMCLCGMLAAEQATLPAEMRARLVGFFDANEAWLCGVLEQGRKTGAMRFQGPAKEQARLLVGSFEGAMLVARSYGEVTRFTQVAGRLLAALTTPKEPAARGRALRRS